MKRANRIAPSGLVVLALIGPVLLGIGGPSGFHFALLGDRTGDAQPGVYEEALLQAAAENPAFILTVGDTIQGNNDQTLESEWHQISEIFKPYRHFTLFLTPGNHDVWDEASKQAFEKYSHHPLHYSFDWQQAHFTILDDSASDDLKASEIAFLDSDLAKHAAQPVKFIVSHRPSWLFPVAFGDNQFALHRLAVKYGVQYVIAGHIHQMLRFNLDGVTYLSMASSGGHLRNDKTYQHGWFFQHTKVTVQDRSAHIQIEELTAPYGKGRVTDPLRWGPAGLLATPN